MLFFIMSNYQAVIFDLGGTLCRYVSWSKFEAAAARMAEMCSAPVDEFVKLYFAESAGMGTGAFSSYREYTRHLLDRLQVKAPDSIIRAAAELPFALTKEVITPRDGALEVLAHLKDAGYKIGLISDCFYDVPEIWPDTPFARFFHTTVFSCDAGMNKADPEIFKIAVEKLGVPASRCIYVADGARNELANAAGLGMKAVQIFVPEERDNSPIREDWRGLKISSLKEILDLL
jgi:putative hydrolase of the HAD superfamily